MRLPSVSVVVTGGFGGEAGLTGVLDVGTLRRSIVFVYPATGTPGKLPADGWDSIAGARGCTPESLCFKSAYDDIVGRGWSVYGLSGQKADEQQEASRRLELPYPLLSDENFTLVEKMNLPDFHTEEGGRYMARHTLIIDDDGVVAAVNYPVFPTDKAAEYALAALPS
ncbi:hypothetical protein PYCC9005_005420 [Savitreella phatthalungensis]